MARSGPLTAWLLNKFFCLVLRYKDAFLTLSWKPRFRRKSVLAPVYHECYNFLSRPGQTHSVFLLVFAKSKMASTTVMLLSLMVAAVSAHDGVSVTFDGEDPSHRKLQGPMEMVRCADMTFNGLEEGSIIPQISVGSGIDMIVGEETIPGFVEVYGMRRGERNFDTPISQLNPLKNRVSSIHLFSLG